MRPVTREEIIGIWDWLCELGPKESNDFSRRFFEQQTPLGLFITAQTEVLGEQGSDSPVIELVLMCWEALTRVAQKPLKTVSPEEIEEADQANIDALQQLDDDSEIEGEQQMERLVQAYNQREMLGFALEVLMLGNEETPDLARESVGLEMLWVKTAIDVLDQ